MLADCCNQFRSYLAPVPPEKEAGQWNSVGFAFEFGTLSYGAGAVCYSISLFISGGKLGFVLPVMAYTFKAASGGCFLKSSWHARKIDNFEAKELATKGVVLVVGIIFSEIFMDGLTTYDHLVDKYVQTATGIFLNCLIFGSACTIVNNKPNLDYVILQ